MNEQEESWLSLTKEEMSLNTCCHSVFSIAVNFAHMVTYDQ